MEYLDKFMGDGIFAYFGYQEKNFDKVYSNAMNAALEFKINFKKIKEKHTSITIQDLFHSVEGYEALIEFFFKL